MPCGDLPLKSKIVLVTGAGSGINLSFAKLVLQEDPLGIVIADLKLTTDAEEFVHQNSSKVIFEKCDVTKRADLENLVKVSVKSFGDVPDVYVAGAGVFEPAWSNWWSDTEDDRYAELDINVTHALKLSRIGLRSLLAKGKRGAILIVASLAGYQGTFAAPLYCASKHAVIGFVRSMALLEELEDIKVVAIAPGLVKTPLWTDRPDVMQQFGYTDKYAVEPEVVAKTMMEAIVKGEHGSGTSLEVSVQGVRSLETWNIPAPAGHGTTVPQEARDAGHAPLKAIMSKDKQSKL